MVRGSNTPLIMAEGGGAVSSPESKHAGCNASTSTAGNRGHNPWFELWSAGSNGHGAKTADNDNSGDILINQNHVLFLTEVHFLCS